MSLLVMSLGDKFCVSGKGRSGGGGWVHPKGTNSKAVSELSFRTTSVGSGWVVSLLLYEQMG